MIKKGIINFEYFFLMTKLSRFEVAVGKDTRHQTCCLYVLLYSSPLPFYPADMGSILIVHKHVQMTSRTSFERSIYVLRSILYVQFTCCVCVIGSKVQLLPTMEMSAGKHNACANSKIQY